jgi:hypothetical protein
MLPSYLCVNMEECDIHTRNQQWTAVRPHEKIGHTKCKTRLRDLAQQDQISIQNSQDQKAIIDRAGTFTTGRSLSTRSVPRASGHQVY